MKTAYNISIRDIQLRHINPAENSGFYLSCASWVTSTFSPFGVFLDEVKEMAFLATLAEQSNNLWLFINNDPA